MDKIVAGAQFNSDEYYCSVIRTACTLFFVAFLLSPLRIEGSFICRSL
jgi:hypothetical protein